MIRISLLGSCNLALTGLLVGFGLLLGRLAAVLGLTRPTLGSGALFARCSSGLFLGLALAFLRFGYAALVLLACRLSSRPLACQFLGSLLGSLGLAPFLGLGLAPGFLASYLLGYELVYTGIQLGLLTLLLFYEPLYGFLLFLQLVYLRFLFGLLAFQLLLGALAPDEQFALLPLGCGKLVARGGDLLLLRDDGLALCFLVGCVFTVETHAAIHLVEVVGTEHEHELVLHRTVTMHVAHGLHVAVAAVGQLVFEQH